MLAAGFGIPMLAALNASLGTRLGTPFAAGAILFCVALSAAVLMLFLTGSASALAKAPAQPKHLFLAGLLVAFYVLSVTWVAPVFFVLLGQLASAALIDHFGLFGARVSPLSLTRAGGIALMASGVWLTQQA